MVNPKLVDTFLVCVTPQVYILLLQYYAAVDLLG